MKKAIAIILSIMLVMAITLPAAALDTIAVKSIKLNSSKITLKVGQTYNLKVTFTPANTSQKLVTYATANNKIATVDKNGKITAIKTGTTVIQVVSSSNKKILAKCNVTISQLANISMKVLLATGSDIRTRIYEKYIAVNLPKEFPNVKFEFELGGDSSTYIPKLQIYNASGNMPDVFFITGGVGYTDALVKTGNLLDLAPYLAKDNFLDNYKDKNVVDRTADGKMYDLNAGNDVYFTPRIFYHKDLFAANGVTVPKTLDEFFTVCKTLASKGVIPLSIPGKSGFGGSYLLQAFLDLDNPKIVGDLINNKTDFNNPAIIKAADTVQKLIQAGAFPKGVAAIDYAASKDLFMQKKVAMTVIHTWEMAAMVTEPDVDFMLYPQVNPSVNPKDYVQTWGSPFSGYAAWAKGKNLEQEVKVVESLAMQDALSFNIDDKAPTVLKSGVEIAGQSDLMLRNLAQFDAAKNKIPYLASYAMNPATTNDWNTACEKLMTGKYSGADLSKDMAKSWAVNFAK